MRKILILMGRYLPGYKDGGPLRTIVNVVEALGDEYEFYIGCLDRDHGDTQAYQNINRGQWNQVGKAKVWYVDPGGFTYELILRLADGKDSIYLSSFYDDYGYKTLWLKQKGKIKAPVALASMGVFSEGALSRKTLKKTLFIWVCKLLGLFKGITWSVTSLKEAEDVNKIIGKHVKYTVAEDLPRRSIPGRSSEKHEGFKVAFLSRICAHKGLDIAIDAIIHMTRECEFSIYGPIQESTFWNECVEKLKSSNIKWNYYGDVHPEQVQEELGKNDVMILPTKSENYGHVIFEALSVGCIPVISPYTPWGSVVEKKVGYVVENRATEYAALLDMLSEMDLNEIKDNAVRFAKEKVIQTYETTGYRSIFDQ